jgi:hypothetical protein
MVVNWELVIKDDLIDKLYDEKKNYIEDNLDDFIESLTKSKVIKGHWKDGWTPRTIMIK